MLLTYNKDNPVQWLFTPVSAKFPALAIGNAGEIKNILVWEDKMHA